MSATVTRSADIGGPGGIVLVLGSSGTVGSEVVRQLAMRGAGIRALSRDAEKVRAPDGLSKIRGDMLDPGSIR